VGKALIILTLLLCSFGGRQYQDHNFIASKFDPDDKALIVYKLRRKSNILGQKPKVSFDLEKIDLTDGPIYYHISPGMFEQLKAWGKSYEYLSVKPGFYVIGNISWTEGNVTYSSKKEILPAHFPVKYGAFEIKPGTVNYLVDLEVSCSQTSDLQIKKTNCLEEAKKALAKKAHELGQKLISI